MPICPADHFSVRVDFCDVCGMRIGATPLPPAAAADPPAESCPQCGTARLGQFCEACGFDFASGQVQTSWAFRPAALVPDARVPDGVAAGRAVPDGAVLGSAGVDGVVRGRAVPGDAAPVRGDASAGSGQAHGSGSFGRTRWIAVAAADRGYFDSVSAAGGPEVAMIQFPRYCPERRFRLTGREMRIGRRSTSRGIDPEIDLTGPPTDPGVSHLQAVLLAEPDGGWAVLDPGSANGTLVNGSEIAAGERVPLREGDHIYVGAWTVLAIRAG
jgi:FHA domain